MTEDQNDGNIMLIIVVCLIIGVIGGFFLGVAI